MTERYTYGKAWRKWWLAGLVFGLVIVGIFFLRQTAVMVLERPLFESTCKFQILRHDLQTADGRVASDHFIANEVEKIRSSENTYRVVDRLDLTTTWKVDRNQAANLILESLSVKNILETDIVEVTIRHVNPEDSRDIANEIVAQYSARTKSINSFRIERIQATRHGVFKEQVDRVDQMKKIYDHAVSLADDPATQEQRNEILRSEKDLTDEEKLLRQMILVNTEKRIQAKTPYEVIEYLEHAVLTHEAVSPDTSSNLSKSVALSLPWSILVFLITPFLFRLSCTKKEIQEY